MYLIWAKKQDFWPFNEACNLDAKLNALMDFDKTDNGETVMDKLKSQIQEKSDYLNKLKAQQLENAKLKEDSEIVMKSLGEREFVIFKMTERIKDLEEQLNQPGNEDMSQYR